MENANSNDLRALWNQNRLALGISAAITIGVTIFWLWGFNLNYFNRRDAYDYAQMSLAISQGQGLSTLQILPRQIPYMSEMGLLANDNWPNLSRTPLLSILHLLFFGRLASNIVIALVIQSGFWFLAGIPLVFLLAKRYSNLQVATASVFLYASDAYLLQHSYGGMTETLATTILLALLLVAFWESKRSIKWLLVGSLIALAYLARSQFAILFPLGFLFAWIWEPRTRRIQAVLLILFGVLLTLFPWMLRNASITGDPLFSFNTSRNLVQRALITDSDIEMHLYAPVEVVSVIERYGDAILRKFFDNFLTGVTSLRYWLSSFRRFYLIFLLLFPIALLDRQDGSGRRFHLFKWSVALLLVTTFLLLCLTVDSARYYLMFRPLVVIVAVTEIYFLLKRLPHSQTLVNVGVAIALLSSVPLLYSALYDFKNASPDQTAFDFRMYEVLREETEPGSIIASDISERVSLNTGRRTVRLPTNPNELMDIDEKFLEVDYILLSRRLVLGNALSEGDEEAEEPYQDYLDFVDTPEFSDRFDFIAKLPTGSYLYKKEDQG